MRWACHQRRSWGASSLGQGQLLQLPLGLAQVLEGVHGPPVGFAPEPVQLALDGESGEGRVLVVALQGQAPEELRRQYIHAGVQPVRKQRLFREGNDATAAL